MTSISIVAMEEFPEFPKEPHKVLPSASDDTAEQVEHVETSICVATADVEKVSQIVTEADVNKLPVSVPYADAAADAKTATGFFDDPANGDIYEVERLCSRKMINGKEYYLVKWTGWASTHNTWEPTENLIGCDVKEMMKKWSGSVV